MEGYFLGLTTVVPVKQSGIPFDLLQYFIPFAKM